MFSFLRFSIFSPTFLVLVVFSFLAKLVGGAGGSSGGLSDPGEPGVTEKPGHEGPVLPAGRRPGQAGPWRSRAPGPQTARQSWASRRSPSCRTKAHWGKEPRQEAPLPSRRLEGLSPALRQPCWGTRRRGSRSHLPR